MDEYGPLVQTSMDIILHAGNAQTLLMQAMDQIYEEDFTEAKKILVEARKEFTLAHQSQTSIIQSEARGEVIAYSILFNHAQDTLMMTQAQLVFAQSMIRYSTWMANKERGNVR